MFDYKQKPLSKQGRENWDKIDLRPTRRCKVCGAVLSHAEWIGSYRLENVQEVYDWGHITHDYYYCDKHIRDKLESQAKRWGMSSPEEAQYYLECRWAEKKPMAGVDKFLEKYPQYREKWRLWRERAFSGKEEANNGEEEGQMEEAGDKNRGSDPNGAVSGTPGEAGSVD